MKDKYLPLIVLALGVLMTVVGVLKESKYSPKLIEAGINVIIGAGFAGEWHEVRKF